MIVTFYVKSNRENLEGSAQVRNGAECLKLPGFIALVFQENEKNEAMLLRSLAKSYKPLELHSCMALSCL